MHTVFDINMRVALQIMPVYEHAGTVVHSSVELKGNCLVSMQQSSQPPYQEHACAMSYMHGKLSSI